MSKMLNSKVTVPKSKLKIKSFLFFVPPFLILFYSIYTNDNPVQSLFPLPLHLSNVVIKPEKKTYKVRSQMSKNQSQENLESKKS